MPERSRLHWIPLVAREEGSRLAPTVVAAGLWLFAAGTGCAIDEADRCPEGYVYQSDWKVCLVADSSPGTGGAPGQAAGGAAGAPNTALGTPCTGQGECGGAASYCLLNPFAPADPGMCTVEGCDQAACGGDHVCCDCDSVSLVDWPAPLCIPNGNDGQLLGVGCTCD